MANSFLQEYVFSLVPKVDSAALKKAEATMGSSVKALAAKYNAELKRTEPIKKAYEDRVKRLQELVDRQKHGPLSKKQEEEYNKLIKEISVLKGQKDIVAPKGAKLAADVTKLSGKISGVATQIGSLIEVIRWANEIGQKIAENAANISNQFVSSKSMFVNKGTRNIMATFGINATGAQGIQAALSGAGMDISDLGIATAGQRKIFSRLYRTYMEGINSIDPEKLEAFNENVQEYQALRAEFDIKIQTAIMKVLTESGQLPRLLESLEKGLDAIIELISSPLVQFAFDTVINFLTAIIELGNTLTLGLAHIVNGGPSTTNTWNNSSTTNYNYGNTYNGGFGTALSLQSSQINLL